jgi:hypothetical protein
VNSEVDVGEHDHLGNRRLDARNEGASSRGQPSTFNRGRGDETIRPGDANTFGAEVER